MDVLRLVIAIIVVGASCAFLWAVTRGRWRWFAAAVTLNVALGALALTDPNQTDSWGVVAGAGWVFVWSITFATGLIVPAILLWPSGDRGPFRMLASCALGLLWLVAIHTLSVVGPVFDRWDICLPPGVMEDGRCELGPL